MQVMFAALGLVCTILWVIACVLCNLEYVLIDHAAYDIVIEGESWSAWFFFWPIFFTSCMVILGGLCVNKATMLEAMKTIGTIGKAASDVKAGLGK